MWAKSKEPDNTAVIDARLNNLDGHARVKQTCPERLDTERLGVAEAPDTFALAGKYSTFRNRAKAYARNWGVTIETAAKQMIDHRRGHMGRKRYNEWLTQTVWEGTGEARQVLVNTETSPYWQPGHGLSLSRGVNSR